MNDKTLSIVLKQLAREVLQSKSKNLTLDLLSDYKFQSKENENESEQAGN